MSAYRIIRDSFQELESHRPGNINSSWEWQLLPQERTYDFGSHLVDIDPNLPVWAEVCPVSGLPIGEDQHRNSDEFAITIL